MEQFHDYRTVDDRSVVEQAHEIQALVKDLEMHGCELPDKFVVGCMIAKLLPSWTEFATSLKHKRREFDVTQLIGTLDVEDKARAKDAVSFETREPENIIVDESHENIPEEDNGIVTRKSKRRRVAKSFGDDYIIYLVDDTPKNIEEAYSSPDADLWKEAVQSEMDSIMSNGTWEVVDRPYGCKPVGCTWVFKKLRPDGTIEKYKARLVAKGYTQKEGGII
jgi:hypothetical protein